MRVDYDILAICLQKLALFVNASVVVRGKDNEFYEIKRVEEPEA